MKTPLPRRGSLANLQVAVGVAVVVGTESIREVIVRWNRKLLGA